MGNIYTFLNTERHTWIEHGLQFDKSCREANLKILDGLEDNIPIWLSYTRSEWGKIKFQHWFVTTGTHFIEFGSANRDLYNARVTINTDVRYDYSLDKISGALEGKLDQNIRARIRHVMGMSNYSLCLRNCEHVANYIFRGRWVSSQMDSENGILLCCFKDCLMQNQKRLINTFPSCIRPHIFDPTTAKTMYSFIHDHYKASRFEYYLDSEEDTYNVLVVGPTGAGKSHLINVMFNQTICEAKVSHHSVTREIYFIRGMGKVFDLKKKEFVMKKIVVADTIGLCDTEWDPTKIIEVIKGRISSNFNSIDAIYVVFRADRLLKEYVDNINKILAWLNYHHSTNYLRFLFVGTYSDYLDDKEKSTLREEATKIFNLKETSRTIRFVEQDVQSLVYTGFPPEDTLNDLTKERVFESWNSLKWLLSYPGKTDQIPIDYSSCKII